ncbi:MAG TPA: hypothetical protein VMB84_03640 [Stellaceae bacterium]|nr:hypothetical protein [Stellaceae bacterium]
MPVEQMVYRGVEITVVREAPGWAAQVPRFGRTMYYASADEAIDEAIRLMDAFLLPRVIRQVRRAA